MFWHDLHDRYDFDITDLWAKGVSIVKRGAFCTRTWSDGSIWSVGAIWEHSDSAAFLRSVCSCFRFFSPQSNAFVCVLEASA